MPSHQASTIGSATWSIWVVSHLRVPFTRVFCHQSPAGFCTCHRYSTARRAAASSPAAFSAVDAW